MSFGIDIRNSVAIGLGGIATLVSGDNGTSPPPPPVTTWNVIDSASVTKVSPFTVYNSTNTLLTCLQTVYNSSGTAITPA